MSQHIQCSIHTFEMLIAKVLLTYLLSDRKDFALRIFHLRLIHPVANLLNSIAIRIGSKLDHQDSRIISCVIHSATIVSRKAFFRTPNKLSINYSFAPISMRSWRRFSTLSSRSSNNFENKSIANSICPETNGCNVSNPVLNSLQKLWRIVHAMSISIALKSSDCSKRWIVVYRSSEHMRRCKRTMT